MFLRSAKTASLASTTLIFLRRCEGWEWIRLSSVLEWCSCCGVLKFCFTSSGFPSLLRGWSFSSVFWFSLIEYPSVAIWMSQRLSSWTPSQKLSTSFSDSSSLIFSSLENVAISLWFWYNQKQVIALSLTNSYDQILMLFLTISRQR